MKRKRNFLLLLLFLATGMIAHPEWLLRATVTREILRTLTFFFFQLSIAMKFCPEGQPYDERSAQSTLPDIHWIGSRVAQATWIHASFWHIRCLMPQICSIAVLFPFCCLSFESWLSQSLFWTSGGRR